MKRRSPRFIGLIIVMSAISVVPQFFLDNRLRSWLVSNW